jgi:hypothetical protein
MSGPSASEPHSSFPKPARTDVQGARDRDEPLGLLDRVWRWYFYSFLNHFLVYVPLPLTILLCVAMLADKFGESYGVDKLVWHDDGAKQFFVGTSLVLLCAQVFYVGYLFWLRDQREGYVIAEFPEVSYGEYSWRTLGCFLATGLLGLLVAVLMEEAIAHVRKTSEETVFLQELEAANFTYRVPWFPLLGALGCGFGFWLLCEKRHLGKWLQKRLSDKALPAAWAASALGFLVVSAGFLVGTVLILLRSERGDEYPPRFWCLILGAFAGGLLVWLLTYVNNRIALGQETTARLLLGKDWLDNLMRKPEQPWEKRRQSSPWVVAPFVWSAWILLLWTTWPHTPQQPWLGFFLVMTGLLLTVCALIWPNKPIFGLCLMANIMATVSVLTWFPSNYKISEWHLLLLYPLSPVALVLTVVLLICYAPRAAAAFFRGVGQGRKSGPETGSAEDLGRRRAGWAVLGGWIFFVALSSSPLGSSVSTVCALLFVLVGLYGFVGYVLRRALAPLVAALAILAVLSGVNRYKFRFPGPLDRYEAGTAGIVDVQKGPLRLHDLLRQDKEHIDAERPSISLYIRARTNQEEKMAYVDAQRGAIAEAEGQEQIDHENIRRLKEELKRSEVEEETARRYARSLQPEAEKAFRRLMERDRVLEAPYPGSIAQLLSGEDVDKDLLFIERIGWQKFGALGGGPVTAEGSKKPLLLVAVSGGALRSAVWSLLILHQLERAFIKKQLDFPAHVRLITGASGGMLGASYYVAKLEHPRDRGKIRPREDELRDQVRLLRQDSIDPLMRQFVFGDVPNFFSPWPAKHDRGKTLEDAWRVNLDGALDVTFSELRRREKEGWCPSLVLTPMMIEDGRRLVISNLSVFSAISNDGRIIGLKSPQTDLTNALIARGVLRDAAEALVKSCAPDWNRIAQQIQVFDYQEKKGDKGLSGASLANAIRQNSPPPDGVPLTPYRPYDLDGNYSIEAFELFRLFPEAKQGLQLGTAVRMSASFPFFSPVVSLPTWPRRRVVDAGYYDNYGVSLSASWLFSGRNRDWLEDNATKLCIIQIRDGVSDVYRRLEKVKPDVSTEMSRGLEELFSPLEGLDNARVSSSSFRNDGQLELLSQFMEERHPFLVVNFEYAGRAAMNWRLSEREFEDLRKRAEGPEIQSQIDALLNYLYPVDSE